jgi:hypothetical protein
VSDGDGLIAIGLDGLVMKRRSDDAPFEIAHRPDRAALTAVAVNADGRPILFSNDGSLAGRP